MSLLFFVNTNKIRNYSYIKGRSQYPFTSHESLRNNFSFHSKKGIHHMHYIWYGGEPLACPLHIPHNDHVFYHKWASEPPDFLFELLIPLHENWIAISQLCCLSTCKTLILHRKHDNQILLFAMSSQFSNSLVSISYENVLHHSSTLDDVTDTP